MFSRETPRGSVSVVKQLAANSSESETQCLRRTPMTYPCLRDRYRANNPAFVARAGLAGTIPLAVQNPSDQDLLDRWRAGDNAAGNELLSRYFGPVRRFFATKISGDDVKDLVQRTFAGCIEGAHRFRGDGSFRAFILAIARRQLYKYLRDRSRHNAREDADLSVSSITALGQSPTSVIAAAQRESLLLQALQRIPVEQQTLLELHYWERLPAPELAEVLDIEPGAVRVRLHRARRAVEKVLSELVGPNGEPVDIDTTARVLGLAV